MNKQLQTPNSQTAMKHQLMPLQPIRKIKGLSDRISILNKRSDEINTAPEEDLNSEANLAQEASQVPEEVIKAETMMAVQIGTSPNPEEDLSPEAKMANPNQDQKLHASDAADPMPQTLVGPKTKPVTTVKGLATLRQHASSQRRFKHSTMLPRPIL